MSSYCAARKRSECRQRHWHKARLSSSSNSPLDSFILCHLYSRHNHFFSFRTRSPSTLALSDPRVHPRPPSTSSTHMLPILEPMSGIRTFTGPPVNFRTQGSRQHPTCIFRQLRNTARATRSQQRLEECRANAACFKSRGSVSQSRPNVLVCVESLHDEDASDSRESVSRAQLPTAADIAVC